MEAGRPRLYAIAKEQYGIEMNPGPSGLDSRPALIGAKVAESMGKGSAYNLRVLHAYWEEAADIENPAILADLAEEAGLPRDEFLAGLNEPRFAVQVDEDIALASEYGLGGVPAMVFQNRYLVSGAQPLAVLRQVVEQVRNDDNKPSERNEA